MYVSPAVRSIRDDPIEGESVTLLLETDDDTSPDELAAAVRDVGGTVVEELPFETLEVRVGHDDVGAICDLGGIESVETSNTLAMDADGAGEDVRPE